MSEARKPRDTALSLIIILFAITSITGLLLGLVNFITEEIIANKAREKTELAMREVLPGEFVYEELLEYAGGSVNNVYAAKSGSEISGYICNETVSGFGGMLNIIIGISKDGEITGLSIVSHSETSGLGSEAAKPQFKDQFIGATDSLAVNKDGGTIDALTGATITSRAVTDAVNLALEVFDRIGG
ncbi:RnfABCDGE type electron transport complex subunit G [Clostridiaceae bacterium OttesenSCG-928-D20]|nr:RnfABCDGE type electron transport complex subunit G [Clostridiaceae bacterium OttesenSCG-928-D20]